MEEAKQACQFVKISEETKNKIQNYDGENIKLIDINVHITLKPDQWTRILEQIVLMVLIVGRFLLPKGNLSRLVVKLQTNS